VEWQVTLDVDVNREVTPDLLGDLRAELELFDAAVAGQDRSLSVTMTVTTTDGNDDDPEIVVVAATDLLTQTLAARGVAVTARRAGEAITGDKADARFDEPD